MSRPGYGKFLRNSGRRLIANDFPIESKIFRRLMKDSLSARPASADLAYNASGRSGPACMASEGCKSDRGEGEDEAEH
jgi:hypothetical protein